MKSKTDIHIRSFITSDWKNSRDRFSRQTENIAEKYGFFATSRMVDESYLLDDFWKSDAGSAWDAVGHSYYAWKPYVINRLLTEDVPDGDALFYADGGCCFPNPPALSDIFSYIRDTSDKIANYPCNTPYIAANSWRHDPFCVADCCLSLLDFFGLRDDKCFTHGFPHYEAGCLILVNNEHNRNFVRLWWDTMRDHTTDIFRDKDHGLPGYVHNSNDQAVMQALLYKTHASVDDSTHVLYGTGYCARARG